MYKFIGVMVLGVLGCVAIFFYQFSIPVLICYVIGKVVQDVIDNR